MTMDRKSSRRLRNLANRAQYRQLAIKEDPSQLLDLEIAVHEQILTLTDTQLCQV